MPRRQTCIRAHVPERKTGVSGQPPAPCQHPGRAAARPRNPPGQAATTARPPARAHARLTGIFTPAQRATGTPGLACHADPVCRSTSEGVERGATHLQQQSEWVAGSLGVPEHAGSRFWLPRRLSETDRYLGWGDHWVVGTWPRYFTGLQAITALTIAERLAAGNGDDDPF